MIEGTIRSHGGGKLAADGLAVAQRCGKNKATVAIARKVLAFVYYGLRDGEILAGPRQHETARTRRDARS